MQRWQLGTQEYVPALGAESESDSDIGADCKESGDDGVGELMIL